jgi:hypothetical protein
MLNKYECLDEIDSLQKHEPVWQTPFSLVFCEASIGQDHGGG